MNVYYMYMYIEHRQTMHRWDTTCTAQMQGTCICTCMMVEWADQSKNRGLL